MSQLNHYAISTILGSEIVGPVPVGHGQIASMGDAQRYFDTLRASAPPTIAHHAEVVDVKLVTRAFLEVRKNEGSTELYIADPDKNAEFLRACRRLGVTASVFKINKTLSNARKNRLLKGLKSKKTIVDYKDFAFASEFAATQLRYRHGATIDDILCDPDLSAKFDALARRLSPGRTFFEYRWAILSIRKAGRLGKDPALVKMPQFKSRLRLFDGPLDEI